MNIKHNYDMNVFNSENANSYYLLGAWASDGNIQWRPPRSYCARLCSNDYDWLEIIKNIICPTLPISKRSYDRGNPTFTITLSKKEIAEWFIKNECVPKKSLVMKFPSLPEEFLPDFLRGCWDGDGWISIYKNKNRNERITLILSSGSYNFLLETQNKLKTIYDIKSSITTTKGTLKDFRGRQSMTHDCHKLNISGACAIKLCRLLYYPGHTISMPRKLKIANIVFDKYPLLD
jgi:hypothetical protein